MLKRLICKTLFFRKLLFLFQTVQLQNGYFLEIEITQLPAICLQYVVFDRFHYTARLSNEVKESKFWIGFKKFTKVRFPRHTVPFSQIVYENEERFFLL